MILTKTPLRVSLLGGGTDFPSYFANSPQGGAVISAAISQYVYVALMKRQDHRFRVGYTGIDLVEDVHDLKHDLIRNAILTVDPNMQGVEIDTMATVKGGSGLGSSAAVTVGVLKALYTYRGIPVGRSELVLNSVEIEGDAHSHESGYQDQAAAVYGGLNMIRLRDLHGVDVSSITLPDSDSWRKVEAAIMLFDTGKNRRAAPILRDMLVGLDHNRPALDELTQIALDGHHALMDGDLEVIGELMHESWLIKRRLSTSITNEAIDDLYQIGRNAGALGGKISGAGGGGYLLLWVPDPQARKRVWYKMMEAGHPQLETAIDPDGTRVVLDEGDRE